MAQSARKFDLMKDDISGILPPLETLIDSAITNDPHILFRDQQIIVNTNKFKANRIEWTKNIGIQADLRYGNFYSYSTNSAGGIDPSISSNHNDTKYGGALYLNLPFYTLANRKNQLKIAKTEIEQAQSMALAQRDERRQLVITQYNDVILKQHLIKIKAKYLETARVNMQMIDKEFSNGIISVSEYARISETISRTETDFENARMDFLTAYMILEEIVGFKFNIVNHNPDLYEHN
jgi:outer membrane protein TolC